jgi:hypothetical protein
VLALNSPQVDKGYVAEVCNFRNKIKVNYPTLATAARMGHPALNSPQVDKGYVAQVYKFRNKVKVNYPTLATAARMGHPRSSS